MTAANSSRNSAQSPVTHGTQYNVRDAALLGASSAFSKPLVRPKPLVTDYSGGNNGAFLAATKAGTGNTRTSAAQGNGTPVKRDWTGGSYQGNLSPVRHSNRSSSSSLLDVPLDSVDRTSSPSNIAAKLAAARFSPMRPKPDVKSAPVWADHSIEERDILPSAGSVGNAMARLNFGQDQQLRRKTSVGGESMRTIRQGDVVDDSQATDMTPIPPTTSLVKMFERNRPNTLTRRPSAMEVSRAPTPVKSPKPQRNIRLSLENSMGYEGYGEPEKPPQKPAIKEMPLDIVAPSQKERKDSMPFKAPRGDSAPSPPIKRPSQLAAVKSNTPPRKPPSRKGSRKNTLDFSRTPYLQKGFSKSAENIDDSSLSSSYESAPEIQADERSKMTHQFPRRSVETASATQADEKPKPTLPPPRCATGSASRTQADKKPQPTLPPKHSLESDLETQADDKPKPTLPPPRRATRKAENTAKVEPTISTMTPSPSRPKTPGRSSMISPPTLNPPRPSPMSIKTHSSETMYHSNYQRESVRKITKHMTGESLSNAIVGAALASSRTTSPHVTSTATPPLPSRQEHHHHYPFHHKRTPSPPKPKHEPGKLRSTMRKNDSSSSEDESERYKRKGTRVLGMGRKHPNKHHEGTRKRWRDTITERERKRYEGVWAANKGLYLVSNSQNSSTAASHSPARTSHSRSPVAQDNPSSEVINLVVKEIWARSRLPDHVLEEIWDLVDSRGVGRLQREEFVVGLWLIDQRLKGRKLPLRVSESVWGSVKGAGVAGVKVRVGGRK